MTSRLRYQQGSVRQCQHLQPDPEIFLKGAAALGLTSDECIVFEDAESGVRAAHAAGMKCIGVGEAVHLPSAKMCITD